MKTGSRLRRKRYLAGDIDMQIFSKYVPEIIEGYSERSLYAAQLGTYYYAFNTQKGPTADFPRSSGAKYDH